MRTFDNLSPEEEEVLIKLLKDDVLQALVGAGNWSLTLEEEEVLWELVKNLP